MRVCCAALCTSRPFQPLLCTLCFLLSPRSRFRQAVHVISFTFWRRRPWRSRRALACHAAWGVMAVPPLRGRRSGIHCAPVCIVFTFQEHLCLPERPPTGVRGYCADTSSAPPLYWDKGADACAHWCCKSTYVERQHTEQQAGAARLTRRAWAWAAL